MRMTDQNTQKDPVSVQLDLFGDFERQQQAAARWRQPATCPSCGSQELSGYALRQHHGYDVDGTIGGWPRGEHPVYGGACVAQALVSSHIAHAARCGEAAVLKERMERGRVLGLDVETIARRAREVIERHAGTSGHY